MTSNDVMKFCEKGSHSYEEVDILRSLKEETGVVGSKCAIYILFQCSVCPSKWVKKI